jgi:GDPmannose 4,6-dehydratase
LPRRALITGITGQDGYYLSRLLLENGYEVWGVSRRAPEDAAHRLDDLAGSVRLLQADPADSPAVRRALDSVQPDEIYNLGAQSSVAESFRDPAGTLAATGAAAVTLMEAALEVCPRARFLQPASGAVFDPDAPALQDESTPMRAVNPYAEAKVLALRAAAALRASRGFFAVNAILYNHESPLRPAHFVTRKITLAAARIALGVETQLTLGNLDARRDWGHAHDYARAMWMMMQHDTPDDFVIATGVARSVAEFCDAAFARAGLDWRRHVVTDPALLRPAEAQTLVGDASKARRALGWLPEVPFADMVAEMVDADMKRVRDEVR